MAKISVFISGKITDNRQELTWRFLDTGKESALFNMALDEAVFKAVIRGESPPTIRLYEWRPEAITLGYAQRLDDVIDYDRCVDAGLDVTRRLTGGRAVYHKNEIAYSVIGSVTDCHFGGSISETYRLISAVLCEGINRLDVAAILHQVKSSAGKAGTDSRTSLCYSSTSRYEITVDGKKLVGSAQKRLEDFFLQQGSILTGPGYEKITEYMKDKARAEYNKRLLLEKSIDISSVINRQCDINNLKSFLRSSFEKELGTKLTAGVPTDVELESAKRLAPERYGSKGWVKHNERRTYI